MLFYDDYIVPKKLWKPFVDLFRHGIGISSDGHHVQGLIEVLFPRMSHWCKWEITVKNLFDNGGVERRTSLVSFGRFESSKGKGLPRKRILGWWSRQVSLNSSRKEGKGKFSQVDSPENLGVKDLGSPLSNMSL
jgi:hypothetical protein